MILYLDYFYLLGLTDIAIVNWFQACINLPRTCSVLARLTLADKFVGSCRSTLS